MPDLINSDENWGSIRGKLNSTLDGIIGSPSTGVYYAKAYNVKGDGTTDDRAAIQSLIDLIFSRGGGIILFAPGTYRIGSPGLNMKSNVSLIGLTRERGTTLKRDTGATYPLISAVGVSIRTKADGTGHIRRCRFENLQFHGADAASNLMDFRGASILEWDNCEFVASLRQLFVCYELFDSRFWNCRFGYGGSSDGTYYATEFFSGTDEKSVAWENTNHIHFYSCVWESNRGKIISMWGKENGFATNEMYFTNCKMENNEVNLSGQIHIQNAADINFDYLQICTTGFPGTTLTDIMNVSSAIIINGFISWEHRGTVASNPGVHSSWISDTPTAASVTRFATMNSASPIHLTIVTNGAAAEKITASNMVEITGGPVNLIECRISCYMNRMKKTALNSGWPNITTDMISLDSPMGSMGVRFRSRADSLTKTGVWDMGRIENDGAGGPRMRLVHNNGTNEATIMSFSQERETTILAPKLGVINNIVAAGSTQGGATNTSVEGSIYIVTSATAGSAEGVRLPSGATGKIVFFRNNSAAQIKLYPQTGGSINGGTVNDPITLDAGATKLLLTITANTWITV